MGQHRFAEQQQQKHHKMPQNKETFSSFLSREHFRNLLLENLPFASNTQS